MAALFGSHAAQAQVDLLAEQVAATRQRNPAGLPVFVPIWYQPGLPEWWMTFNQHTFTHDVLTLCGFQSIFTARERRYPLAADLGSEPAKPAEGRDTRYPRVTAAEIAAAGPRAALLPSEPYAFAAADTQHLAGALGGQLAAERIRLIDGSLLTWPGMRIAQAIPVLQALRAELA